MTLERHGIRVRRFAGSALYSHTLTEPVRVAHLTDMHVGLVTPMKVQAAAIDITLREKPDLVVITGDFVCHSHAFLEDLTELMRQIDVPLFAVLGNHDYWAGAPGVRTALKRGGAELLSNQSTVIEVRGQKLQLVGLDDAYTGHADRRRALRGASHTLPTLGLSHIAEEADGLWAHGVPFVLSGHTHGGQLGLVSLGLPYTMLRLFVDMPDHGLWARGRDRLYVHRGTGHYGFPLRLGVPAEASLLNVHHRAGA